MKLDIATRWVAKLRSGEYTQGKGYLCKDGKHCCLGVLCELAAEDGVIERRDTGYTVRFEGSEYGSDIVLPTKVKDWAGIKDNCGVFFSDGGNLATMNDTRGYDFHKIAKQIETRYEEL